MKGIPALLQRCCHLLLIVSMVSVTTAQIALGAEADFGNRQDSGLAYVEKQQLSDEEIINLGGTENVDQITAGHHRYNRGYRNGPYHDGPAFGAAGNALFWTGFLLISLSFAIYPY